MPSRIRCSVSALIAICFLIRIATLPLNGQETTPLTAEQLFSADELLDIRITIAEKDWKKLSGQTLDFVSAFSKGSFSRVYTFFPADLELNGRRLPHVDIRKKGFFGSTDTERPSLKVRIEHPDSNRLVAAYDRLTFNNNKQDRSCASQFIAYRLFREAGLPAPRSSMAKVTVNGKLLGVYTHVESIDERYLRRQFGNDTGDLYEGVFPTDFIHDRVDRFNIKTNNKNTDRGDLRRLAEILDKPDAPEFLTELEKRFDLDEFIRYWALESLIAFWDGYASNQNNYYLYKNPKDGKFHFIPWGADVTLAPPVFFSRRDGMPAKSVFAKGILAYRLNQIPAMRDRYQATMLKLLETVWNEEKLIADVDRIETLAKGQLHEAQGNIEEAAEATRKYIRERRQEIMDEIKDGPVHITTPPAKPFYMREAGQASATFSTDWTASGDQPAESEQATVDIVLNGEKVKFKKVVATAGPSRFPAFGGNRGGRPQVPPPTIALVGERESDQKKITLTVFFAADQFGSTEPADSINVQGMMVEGEGFMFGAAMKSFIGKAELKSASQEKGGKVVGSLQGRLFEMRNGFGG
ncbi:MAG: hypothetical protein FJ295_10730 [Planctomycetes bacterium]|nr:hypothetical protein [Planctomycetota bacterium]